MEVECAADILTLAVLSLPAAAAVAQPPPTD